MHGRRISLRPRALTAAGPPYADCGQATGGGHVNFRVRRWAATRELSSGRARTLCRNRRVPDNDTESVSLAPPRSRPPYASVSGAVGMNWNGYEVSDPGVDRPLGEFPRREARAAFDRLMDARRERIT